MSDNLRTRIAAVLTDHTWIPLYGLCECGSTDKNYPAHVADVLIRELNLIDGDALDRFLSDIKTAFDIGIADD